MARNRREENQRSCVQGVESKAQEQVKCNTWWRAGSSHLQALMMQVERSQSMEDERERERTP